MAHPLDILVGQRIRQRRSLLGMSMQQLGESVGITNQQVEQHETGADRVSAGRIWDFAAALKVPVLFFFEGLDGQSKNAGEACCDVFTDKETLDLVRA